MSGSTSNITTQWTFRDGRDYLLSLTTTGVPNTLSFWISDKITGEEWTASYDESGIEVITKRTGCYKSFHTFLSMIKSAILKKSEAVIIELLNMDDLNAISLHRQHLQHGGVLLASSAESSRTLSPLNFQLYNSELDSNPPSLSQLSQKSNKTSPAAPAVNVGNGNHPKNSTKIPVSFSSSLNKRKYLIVTYIAEFDRVHYPLPLNYSNPPDLNVMQRNILQLKAEVVSLQSAKKELASELQVIKSGSLSQPSHEDYGRSQAKTVAKSSSSPRKQGAIINNFEPAIAIEPSRHKDGLGDTVTLGEFEITGEDDKEPSTVFCQRCSGTMASLQAKIRDLEHATDFQKGEHMQAMEKLENENHFLRYKMEAAEKYEMELWGEIQLLKEKVDQVQINNEKQIRSLEECKDARKGQSRQSRHDVFYRSYKKPISPRKKSTISYSKPRDDKRRRPASMNSLQSRRSNSPRSSLSNGSIGGKSDNQDNAHKETQRSRSSFSAYNPSYCMSRSRGRRESASPSKSRFDPTAYIAEKKQRQSKIANIRMQNIESRILSNSRTRSVSRTKSIERSVQPQNLQPFVENRNQRSSSRGRLGLDNEPNSKTNNQETDVIVYYENEKQKRGENRLGKSVKPLKTFLTEDHERFFAKPLTQLTLTPLSTLTTPDYISEINKRVLENTEKLLIERPKSSPKADPKNKKEPQNAGNRERTLKTRPTNARKQNEEESTRKNPRKYL